MNRYISIGISTVIMIVAMLAMLLSAAFIIVAAFNAAVETDMQQNNFKKQVNSGAEKQLTVSAAFAADLIVLND